jgi:hypothetical protein
VAQSGSAGRLGRQGRRFESCHPDQQIFVLLFFWYLPHPIMSFVIALGAFLGFITPQNPVLALSVLAAVLIAKGIFDVRYSHVKVFNRPSPFLHYCKNLMERDEEISGAGFSYMLQLVIFGMLTGGGMYALVRFLR